jgi:REP element-mobilizing transposase RayT
MPRQARIDAPGALHHIIIRGIDRRNIFKDNIDRKSFLDRLGAVLSDTATSCYAWSLMSNHVHLLLRTGTVPIATLMRRLFTGHAVTFNRRHRCHGPEEVKFYNFMDVLHLHAAGNVSTTGMD